MSRVGLVLVLLALGAVEAAALDEREVALDVEDRAVPEVIAELSTRTGVPLLCRSGVGERVTLHARGSVADLVARIASASGCEVERYPGGALVLQREPRISMQFTDASVRFLFPLAAAYSGENIVLAPDVQGTATIDVTEAPWREVVREIAAKAHFSLLELDSLTAVSARRGAFTVVEGIPARIDWPAGAALAADHPIDLDLDRVPFAEAIASIASRIPYPIRVASVAPVETVTLHARNVSWRDAIIFIARDQPARMRVERGGLVLTPAPRLFVETTDLPGPSLVAIFGRESDPDLACIASQLTGTVTLDLHELPVEDVLRAAVFVQERPEPFENLEARLLPLLDALDDLDCDRSTRNLRLKIDALLAAMERSAPRRAVERLPEWKKHLGARDLRDLLEVDVNGIMAEQLIERITAAKEARLPEKATEPLHELHELADEMIRTKPRLLGDTARDALARGAQIAAAARELRSYQVDLRYTARLHDERGDHAIIGGRLCSDDQTIPGTSIRVLGFGWWGVRLRAGQDEFVQELASPRDR